jgi:uncharacterized membrane protein
MLLQIVKYVPVFLGSMFKFILGPINGLAMGLTLIETIILTVLGMMTSVIILINTGHSLKRWYYKRFPNRRHKKKFTRKNRNFIRIWQKYGVIGVSILTPVLFSPIGGPLLISYFGAPRRKVIFFMTLSALFWSIIVNSIFYFVLN